MHRLGHLENETTYMTSNSDSATDVKALRGRPAGSGKAAVVRSIEFREALDLILTAESGNKTLTDHQREELPAIVSHWLQKPSSEPLVLGVRAGDHWRSILATNNGGSCIKGAGKTDEIPIIDYSSIPFPPVIKPKFNFIDLFAGIGGFHISLRDLGGKCVFSSEWETHAKETYGSNFGEIPFGDLTNFTANEDSPPLFVNSVPDHDILTAGFPCQPFSQAGRQLGFSDARGTLFFEVLKIASEKQPKILILENVKRLKTHDSGKTFSVIINSLREIGYKVYAKVLRAYDYGLPQNRERIFIVAFDRPIHFEFPVPSDKRKIKCVGDILEQAVDERYTVSDRMLEGHLRRLREHKEKGNGFGFSVFSPESKYTNTISARYWKDGSEILIDQKGKNPRMLTPRECARLQGFPDIFNFNKSRRHAYQQFGNSVPVNVVRAVAEAALYWERENEKSLSLLDPYEPIIF